MGKKNQMRCGNCRHPIVLGDGAAGQIWHSCEKCGNKTLGCRFCDCMRPQMPRRGRPRKPKEGKK